MSEALHLQTRCGADIFTGAILITYSDSGSRSRCKRTRVRGFVPSSSHYVCELPSGCEDVHQAVSCQEFSRTLIRLVWKGGVCEAPVRGSGSGASPKPIVFSYLPSVILVVSLTTRQLSDFGADSLLLCERILLISHWIRPSHVVVSATLVCREHVRAGELLSRSKWIVPVPRDSSFHMWWCRRFSFTWNISAPGRCARGSLCRCVDCPCFPC